jgi:hypothetical protein
MLCRFRRNSAGEFKAFFYKKGVATEHWPGSDLAISSYTYKELTDLVEAGKAALDVWPINTEYRHIR